ncbi:MAG: polymer-forming cytoskeletal protein [Shewanellaceae bacterium]|nr:polymer-forming cytoskeletal protein [Shewanellaceae bacterium]
MFTKKTKPLTFISSGCKIDGVFNFEGDALIAGTLDGRIQSKSNVVIEKQGIFQGQLSCLELQVSGRFNGSVSCQRLIIHNDGSVEGEVYCEYMEIYDQGQFIGVRVKETPKWLLNLRNLNEENSETNVDMNNPDLTLTQDEIDKNNGVNGILINS